jgi:hypothetical protein
MLEAINPEDNASVYVVVHGVDRDAFELAAVRFGTRRGGADPKTLVPYISIPIEQTQLEDCLSWVQGSLAGRYDQIVVGASVGTTLSWSKIVLSPSILSVVSRFNASLSITFSSARSAQLGAGA